MLYKGEPAIAEYLSKEKHGSVKQISQKTKLNIDTVRRAVSSLEAKDYVTIKKNMTVSIHPTSELEKYISDGFPEFTVSVKKQIRELSPTEKRIGLAWAKRKGFVDIHKGEIVSKRKRDELNTLENEFIRSVKELLSNKTYTGGIPKKLKDIYNELDKRGLIKPVVTQEEFVMWVGKTFNESKTFDISNPVDDAPIGKNHPITVLQNKIRNVFASLGFEEIEGNIIESAFWNFDALFQPQDHPARELADTFYIDGNTTLPDDRTVSKIQESHEKHWRYKWSMDVAKRMLLRTHTTAVSAKYLHKNKKEGKFFSIGRVFRNETIDPTHLAEFYQVEGIIVWKDANFRHLLGILKLFYEKLGFDKIRFSPSYFPYTEPSLEIEVFFKERNEWLELGGAGIFRPEVTKPLCGCYPVLAWGLSLERPLMLKLGLKDIRDLYNNDAKFLRSTILNV